MYELGKKKKFDVQVLEFMNVLRKRFIKWYFLSETNGLLKG